MYSTLDNILLNFSHPQFLEVENQVDRFQHVSYRKSNSETRYVAIEDTVTGNYYRNDEPFLIAKKCLVILFANIVHGLLQITWHSLKIPCHIVYSAIGNPEAALTEKIAEELLGIRRTPYYMLGIEIAAIKGVFETVIIHPSKAFEARNVIAHLENTWKCGVSVDYDIRRGISRLDSERMLTFYLAFCFQPVMTRETCEIEEISRRVYFQYPN